MKEYLNYLVKWIQEIVKQAHADGEIIGITGGIDTAVLGALAKQAIPNQY